MALVPMATVWRVVWLQGRGFAVPLSAQQGRWRPGSGSAGDPIAGTCRRSHCWREWGKQHCSLKEEKNEQRQKEMVWRLKRINSPPPHSTESEPHGIAQTP